jgi:hypothetical protein
MPEMCRTTFQNGGLEISSKAEEALRKENFFFSQGNLSPVFQLIELGSPRVSKVTSSTQS